MTAFELIEANGLTLHGDIEHFAALVAAQERAAAITAIQNIERKGGWVTREDAINAINAIKARETT